MTCRSCTLAIAGLLLSPSLLCAQAPPDRASIEQQIAADEEKIIQAVLKSDLETFHAYTVADSYTVNGAGLLKVGELDDAIAGQAKACTFGALSTSERVFYWLTDTAVVHIFKTSLEGTCNGERLPDARNSTVWVNKGGKWLAAFHQQSEVVPAPAPAPAKE